VYLTLSPLNEPGKQRQIEVPRDIVQDKKEALQVGQVKKGDETSRT
jgi:hypothetical protein